MARKRHSAEEIVGKLRQVDVLIAPGKALADEVWEIGFYVSNLLPLAQRVWLS